MNRGVDHQTIFYDDGDRVTCERLLGDLPQEHGVEIHAYCLMGTHYHALLRCPDGGLSVAMQQFSSSFTRVVNDGVGRDGPLFRGRFQSVPIESDEQVISTVAYIHRNPLDIVPMAAIDAYRWSSLGAYVGRRPAPSWLTTASISAMLAPDEHLALVQRPWNSDRWQPSPVLSRDERATRRAAQLILLMDDLSATTRDAVRVMGFTSDGAVRTALVRARRRLHDDPGFAVLVDRLRSERRAA